MNVIITNDVTGDRGVKEKEPRTYASSYESSNKRPRRTAGQTGELKRR